MKHGNVRRLTAIFAGMLAVSSADLARAQAAPDAGRPAVPAGGNWWNAPAAQQAPDRRPADPLLRRDNSVMDYPGLQMTDWVVASAMAARARAIESQAQSDLSGTIRRVQRRFEHSDDYLKAAAEEKQAYADYTAARQKAIGIVAGNPRYHALSMLRDELADKIAARRHAKDASGEEIAALATLKLEYAAQARSMEVAVASGDPSINAAREKMEQASRHLVDLKARFDDAIHDNPEVLLAKRALDEARIAVVETSALVCSASIASNYALNFAYYLHRNDVGSAFGPYGPNGGGIGASYTSPFWH